jgi:hypothetical protein
VGLDGANPLVAQMGWGANMSDSIFPELYDRTLKTTLRQVLHHNKHTPQTYKDTLAL